VKVLYDTSVLIAALLVNHPNHYLTLPKLEMAQRREVHGYVSTHTLAELYSVMTRLPKPLQVSPDEALSAIADLVEYIEAVPLLPEDYQTAIAQMAALKLPGGSVFDALIAQAAVKANVDCLLTLNPKDFIRLSEAIAALVQVPE
jgi:predicted nucleic acid-binding protein